MFSILIAGRLPQINFQQVSETQFVIPISDVDHVNHLVVFMTGQIPFPENFGGVYFSWPSAEGPSWIYLGKITNAKPSAIFKINKIKDNEFKFGLSLTPALFSGFQHQNAIPTDGLLGISVEPLVQLEQKVQPHDITPSTVASNVEFVTKMLNNFVNYVTSFIQTVPGTSEQIVPLSVVSTWYNNFQRRITENPNYWKEQS